MNIQRALKLFTYSIQKDGRKKKKKIDPYTPNLTRYVLEFILYSLQKKKKSGVQPIVFFT